jgi:hypothetical protein
VEWYISAGTPDKKALQLNTLQKIYEMRNEKRFTLEKAIKLR